MSSRDHLQYKYENIIGEIDALIDDTDDPEQEKLQEAKNLMVEVLNEFIEKRRRIIEKRIKERMDASLESMAQLEVSE